jgi:hypothetical protein
MSQEYHGTLLKMKGGLWGGRGYEGGGGLRGFNKTYVIFLNLKNDHHIY